MRSTSNRNLEVLAFKERGKPEYPEKKLSEQEKEPTTNSTHTWHRHQDLNPGHTGGRGVLSPLHHPYSQKMKMKWYLEDLTKLQIIFYIEICKNY